MKSLRPGWIAWVTRGIFGVLLLVALGATTRNALMMEAAARQSMGIEGMSTAEAILIALFSGMPLLLLFFAAGLLAEALEQHLLAHRLTHRTGAALHWTPRIGMLLFALCVSLFGLDIFGQGYTLWETIVGLTMHLLPTFLLLGVLAVAWRWPAAGGILVLVVAGLFLVQFGGGSDLFWMLLFIGPPVAIGLMFLADWWLRNEVDSGDSTTPAAV